MPTPGPWPTPTTEPPSATELRDGIAAVLWHKRALLKAHQTLEPLQLRRNIVRRCAHEAKAQEDAGWLAALNSQAAALESAAKAIDGLVQSNAERLLHILGSLDPHLEPHQAGALLGIHHQHISRAGGLLQAATSEPSPAWLWIPLWMRMVDALTTDPIRHRAAREKMNELFDLDLPLPPRPRPALVS